MPLIAYSSRFAGPLWVGEEAAAIKPKGKQVCRQFQEAQKRRNELDDAQGELKKKLDEDKCDWRILKDVSERGTRIWEAVRA